MHATICVICECMGQVKETLRESCNANFLSASLKLVHGNQIPDPIEMSHDGTI